MVRTIKTCRQWWLAWYRYLWRWNYMCGFKIYYCWIQRWTLRRSLIVNTLILDSKRVTWNLLSLIWDSSISNIQHVFRNCSRILMHWILLETSDHYVSWLNSPKVWNQRFKNSNCMKMLLLPHRLRKGHNEFRC